jgi:hypothetical protein
MNVIDFLAKLVAAVIAWIRLLDAPSVPRATTAVVSTVLVFA